MTSPNDTTAETRGGLSRRTFLAGTAAAALTATALTTTPASAATYGTLKVGAGKAPISFPAGLLPLDSFTVVHDDIYVRVLLLVNGLAKVAVAVMDLTSVSAEAIGLMRTAISAASGVPTENIVVTCTHTFSAPHVQPSTQSPGAATYVQQIVAATKSAVADAVQGLQPAKVGYGSGESDVNVNRNVETADGWWLGTGENLPSDKTVGVTRFDDLHGNPVAILTNFNVQSSIMMESVMANGDLPITADLAGAAVAHVESQYDKAIGFFLVGACGDQAPAFRSKRYVIDKNKNWSQVDAQDAGWLLLTVQGERLGTEVVRVAETIKTSRTRNATALDYVTSSATVNTVVSGHPEGPTKNYDFVPTGSAAAPIWIIRVGEGAFAGVSPELSTSTALDIRHGSPFKHTFVMSMLEGGAKNMADKWNYDHLTYAAIDGSYARGSAEIVANKIAHLLDRMHR